MFKLKAFLIIWAGQVISLLGSALSGFALGIWLYQTTGSASYFALTALCSVLPQLLVWTKVTPLQTAVTSGYHCSTMVPTALRVLPQLLV